MLRFTLTEFNEYCKKRQFSSYVFMSDRQQYDIYCTIAACYKSVHISLAPNRIGFSDRGEMFVCELPRYIDVEETNGGAVFYIRCGPGEMEREDDFVHILVAKI